VTLPSLRAAEGTRHLCHCGLQAGFIASPSIGPNLGNMTEGKLPKGIGIEKREASRPSWNGAGTPNAGVGSGSHRPTGSRKADGSASGVPASSKLDVEADRVTPAFLREVVLIRLCLGSVRALQGTWLGPEWPSYASHRLRYRDMGLSD
jgi:hypothetical protein